MRHLLPAMLLLLASCSGGGGGAPPPPAGPNAAPQFTSLQTETVVENASAAYQARATDPEGDALTFSIAGGADAARFTITGAGALSFSPAPNFDLPIDADGDNIYAVQIRVSDGRNAVEQLVNITVNNSREGIAVRRVGTGFSQPLYVLGIPGSSDVYVLEKTGGVYRLNPATGVRTLQFTIGNISTGGEGGLLGMALFPNAANSDRFMIYCTNAAGDIEIRLYRFGSGGGAPSLLSTFAIPHPTFDNHNGGWMAFGPDGFLYAGVGDGGGSGDPNNNAQNPNVRLGKMLRIAVDPSAANPFSPATGNPFIAGGGDPYIFALGLRNPFRASFSGNRLFIGDVGQGAVEEIDAVLTSQPGRNFGWRFLEGTQTFSGTPPSGLAAPVAEYSHGTGPRQGNSVTGGYVYRGPVTSLRDHYVFADFIRGNIWTVPLASLVDGQTLPSSQFERRNADFAPDAGTINQLASFGEDSVGNLFIVDFDGEIFLVLAG
jgi:hypothetical protein